MSLFCFFSKAVLCSAPNCQRLSRAIDQALLVIYHFVEIE
jgi:hypothetical protein